MKSLQGQSAIITGGSTEVAGAVALALAKEGVNISLCGRAPDLLELAVSSIKSAGGLCLPIVSNLDTLEDAEAVLAKTQATFGRLDILILVSGFWSGGFLHEHSVKAWDLVMSSNLREPFLMARAALPVLRAQGHGEVMAIGSDSALANYQQDGAYGVALHGLNSMMDIMRMENAEHGIRVHTLSPGLALTPSNDKESKPSLSASDIAEWAVWLLTRPEHLRSNGAILI
jgi:NAD(P)-dependent dehydrogenase (short-subunit alcohol dehydrogenase family)